MIKSEYFHCNIVKNLITLPDETSSDPCIKTVKDAVQLSMKKYENHDSFILIKNMMWNLDDQNLTFKYNSF